MEEKEEIDRVSHLASSRGLGWRQDGLSTLTEHRQLPGTRHPSERGLGGSRGRQVVNCHLLPWCELMRRTRMYGVPVQVQGYVSPVRVSLQNM